MWIGRGYYHFTTYTTNNNNVVSNIDYKQKLDGFWNFIFFAYKRFPEGGKAKPVIWFGEQEL